MMDANDRPRSQSPAELIGNDTTTFKTAQCLAGGGEMGALMRSFDWSATSLGDIAHWSQSLQTSVSICLNSRFPMVIWWGDDLTLLYNDAWQPILGSKHPHALGQPGEVVWGEIWDIIGSQLKGVMETGQATWSNDQLLLVDRAGYIEEAYFTYSYSPILIETGHVGGAFTAVTETTARVLGERQLATLRNLAAQAGLAKSVDQAYKSALQTLIDHSADVPFALFYQVENQQVVLVSATPIADATINAAYERFQQSIVAQGSELIAALQHASSIEFVNLEQQFGRLPSGSWATSTQQAIALPLKAAGRDQLVGVFVGGVNPCRALDEDYRNFFTMMAGHISTAISNATAYEEERRRAEALAELDRAKTTFFSNVSHEFRTPLTLMLAPLEDMLTATAPKLDPQEQDQLKMVHRNGLRLQKLVNTLLDFSRIEAGRSQVVYVPTDLATLTIELASVFRSAIERAGIALQVICPPLPELVYIDRDMWEKIVLNLLSNAFKFTFAGEIEVKLDWHTDYVTLQVRDTGIGIPAAELPHLFERFHRVEGAKGRSYEGSGIGLSLVQDLVKLHGGEISVASIVDSGTCFTIRIPAGSAHLPPDRLGTPRPATSTGAIPYVEEALRWQSEESSQFSVLNSELNLGTSTQTISQVNATQTTLNTQHSTLAHILLADDNADMRDYVKGLLTPRYQVTSVADGAIALAIAREQPPDLILSDVMMPNLNGLELVQQLRTDSLTKEVPIILLSARAGEESRVEGLAVGADDYLVKPFSARELLARVEATLKLSQIRRAAADQERKLRLASETAQQEAELAYERISQILESMTDAFVSLDRDWRIIYQNAAGERINGKSRSEILGKTHWEVWSASVGTNVERQYRKAVAEQIPVHFEHHYFEPPRYDSWLEIHAYPSPQGLGVFYRDITAAKQIEAERQRSENALMQSEEKFRQLANAMPQIVWTTDAVGELEYVSDQWFHYTGLTLEQTRDRDQVTQFMHPDDVQVNIDQWKIALATEAPYQAEFRLKRAADGIYHWYLARAVPIKNEQGQVVHWYGTSTDIHDQKLVELQIQQSNDRFELAAKAVRGMIYDVDVQTGFVARTEGLTRILGYSLTEAEPTLDWWDQQIHPDDLQQCQAEGQAQKDQSDRYRVEYRIRHKQGHYVYVQDQGLVERNADGKPVRIVGSTIDVSEAKQTEIALRQSEERYRYLVESVPQIIWTADPNGILLDVNQRWLDFTGLTLSQVQIEGWQLLIHPDDLAKLSECWQAAQQSGEQYQAEGRMRQANGEYRWHLHRAIAAKNELGQPIKWFGTATNIDEQKQLEHERDRILQQEHAARAEAERANRMKDDFLAVLSHELRTPLNPILGWAKLLRTGKVTPDKYEAAFETIERNAKLQTQLIEDLLDISRILQGKLVLSIYPVDLTFMITAAQETVRLAADAKRIKIQTVFEPNVGTVPGDSARLQQVVWNLLSNAIKFTPEGGHVDVRLTQTSTHANIEISDTGKGISGEFLPYVFDYFRQADGATTRKFGGLGLGLAIARQIVDLHGGKVFAASDGEGQGATFTVQLPLLKKSATSNDDQSSVTLTFKSRSLTGLTILLVDDDADSLDFATFILQQDGATVISVTSALEAIAALKESKIDVLVSDIGMPEMDGYMLIRAIRSKFPLESQIPAIALTAYAGGVDHQQITEAGFQGHVTKPVEPDQLINAIVHSMTLN
jgi:PAS domain S-box-containing protein